LGTHPPYQQKIKPPQNRYNEVDDEKLLRGDKKSRDYLNSIILVQIISPISMDTHL